VSLLGAFGRAFGAEDGTLVIAVPQSAPELGDRLAATASAAGIEGPESADLLAVGVPDGPGGCEILAAHVDAVYSRRELPGAAALLPRFDDACVAELRALAA
jgi:hypothetical protein